MRLESTGTLHSANHSCYTALYIKTDWHKVVYLGCIAYFGTRGYLYKTSREVISLLFLPFSLFKNEEEEETTRKLVVLQPG